MTPFHNHLTAGAVLPAAWMAEMSARALGAWSAQAAALLGATPAPERDPAELRPVGGRMTAAAEMADAAAAASVAPDLEPDVTAMVDAVVDGPVGGPVAPDAGFDPARLA